MGTVLDKIIEHKRTEVLAAKADRPLFDVLAALDDAPPVRSFRRALAEANPQPALIAEVKKASPSAGVIRDDFDPVAVAQAYEAAGAACLSVLTDDQFFQGHLNFLKQIRRETGIPVMRKEFIIDRYQIAEARAVGADCVLLIAECLTADDLQDLHGYARELGMETLIELYEPDNLKKVLDTGCDLVGINNRNLHTCETSLDHTAKLRRNIPDRVLVVSESGIRTHEDVCRLRDADVGAILVGESLMRQPDIERAVRTLMHGTASVPDAD